MDTREIKALDLAARYRIVRDGAVWVVPSQTGSGRYQVDPILPICTCEDFALIGPKPCKHVLAVRYTLERERADSTAVAPPSAPQLPVEPTPIPRTRSKQVWAAYNQAQTHEKHLFQVLLRDLCSGLQDPPQTKGRPRLPLSDTVFAAVFKTYLTLSGRRASTDMREAAEKGYMTKAPHFNSVFNCFENPAVADILRGLIAESSRPLAAVEHDFAGDSSGFSTNRFINWREIKYGAPKGRHDWVKVHLMCGVKTNIVTAVEIHDRDASDTKQLPDLVDTTAKTFTMREVSLDKAYGSLSNYDAIAKHGATPFVPFKSNHTGAGGGLWGKMYHYFCFNKEDFLKHYHKRSNVETVFSMIKAKFGDAVRSKTEVAQKNEAYAKILAHNLCVLIQEMHELGVVPVFWPDIDRGDEGDGPAIIRFPSAG